MNTNHEEKDRRSKDGEIALINHHQQSIGATGMATAIQGRSCLSSASRLLLAASSWKAKYEACSPASCYLLFQISTHSRTH